MDKLIQYCTQAHVYTNLNSNLNIKSRVSFMHLSSQGSAFFCIRVGRIKLDLDMHTGYMGSLVQSILSLCSQTVLFASDQCKLINLHEASMANYARFI